MPPPMTSARFFTGMLIFFRGAFFLSLCIVILVRSFDFTVPAFFVLSWCTHEHCSRMLVISHWKGFKPAASEALRKVFSCMCGEHAATITPSSLLSLMACLNISWPGDEHMNL